MVAAETASALSSLKIAYEMAKGLQSLHTSTEVKQAISGILDQLVTARNDAFEAADTRAALLKRVDDLEQELVSFKTWDGDKERYKLTEISRGVFTYVLKPELANGEPTHCICAECYQHRKKSILQSDGGFYGTATLACPTCKVEIKAVESGANYPFELAPAR